MPRPVAAIDVGSNSIRIAVIRADCEGLLEVIEEARVVPRIIRDISASGRLSDASIALVVDTLRDFQAIARGAGADPVIVATSAVRESANADELVACVREALGLELRVISGMEEAHLAFLGAAHSLPINHGIVADIGGGSLEFGRFRSRQLVESWTLPLGAVRLNEEFLASDPPTPSQLQALREHVVRQLRLTKIAPLAADEQLIGTGGTIRNLAKIDRSRRSYPLPRLHGYALTDRRLSTIARALRSQTLPDRAAVDGLNPDRADAIVAGTVVVQAILGVLKAPAMVVAGHGLREGIMLAACSEGLPSVSAVRRAAVQRAVGLFAPERAPAAARRVAIAESLAGACALTDPELREALRTAAELLDLGRSIDYYSRHRHTEQIILERGLAGFTHREHALINALVRQADREKYDIEAYRPLVTGSERDAIARASTLLAAADVIEQHTPPDAAASTRGAVTATLRGGALVVGGPFTDLWHPTDLAERCLRTLGVTLSVEPAARL
jgi:exopolyphosphatase/guanosine-5'-triphosphate,3'-diphosphate pyrophosphatase